MENRRAEISEIFSSIQGEGVYLGVKQIFVRFKDCNMKCSYCDETGHKASGSYSPEELAIEIRMLDKTRGPHHSVSFTGGEPLLYADFLLDVLRLLKKVRLKTYLETNGTLPVELEKVIGLIDIVAMDFKLPSSTCGKECWEEHLKFLQIASRKKTLVKIVVTSDTSVEDVKTASLMVKAVNKKIPLVLQPAASAGPADAKIDSARLMSLLEAGLQNRLDVRVIPQIHKVLGVK